MATAREVVERGFRAIEEARETLDIIREANRLEVRRSVAAILAVKLEGLAQATDPLSDPGEHERLIAEAEVQRSAVRGYEKELRQLRWRLEDLP